jgi:hypothetical protein
VDTLAFIHQSTSNAPHYTCNANGMRERSLTEDNDVQDQDGETDDSAPSAVLPRVTMVLGGDWSCHGEGQQRELEEHGEHILDHDCGYLCCFCGVVVDELDLELR